MPRYSGGGSFVQAMVVTAVATILVTRAYLAATGYPQVGGGTLHIAHALWGGAAMTVAIVLLLSFIGRRVRRLSVIIGGIGLGLFLDEVGKFLTRSNDYFFTPAISVMYVVLVLLLLVNRFIQDSRLGSPAGHLAAATSLVAECVGSGVSDRQRTVITRLLDDARLSGADPRAVAAVSGTLDILPRRDPGPTERLRQTVTARIPVDMGRRTGRRVTVVAAVLISLFSAGGVVSSVLTVGEDMRPGSGAAVTQIGQLCGSTLAFLLCAGAVVLHLMRRGGLWPLRLLRAASLVTVLLTEIFNFVAEQFGALLNVGVGLLTFLVFSARLRTAVIG